MLKKFTIQRKKYNSLFKNRTSLIDFIFCDYYSGILHHACFKKIFDILGEHSVYCNESYQLLDLTFKYFENTTKKQHEVTINFAKSNFNILYDKNLILSVDYYDFMNEKEALSKIFENIYEKISYYLLCVLSISTRDELFFEKITKFKNIFRPFSNKPVSKEKIREILSYSEPYYPYVCLFNPQNVLYRIRECNIDDFTQPIHGLNRICFKEIDRNNPIGRFNYENEMMLYATYGNESACFFETKPKDKYILTCFNLKNEILVADLTKIYDFNYKSDEVSRDNIFLNILKRKIIKKIVQSNDSLTHQVTNVIKDYVLEKFPFVKGFLYQSIYDYASYNLAVLYNPKKDDNIIFNDIIYKSGTISNDFLITKSYEKFNKETYLWEKIIKDPTIHTSTSFFLSKNTIIDIFKDIERKL